MGKKLNLIVGDENSYRSLLQESYNDSILLINEATRHISILEQSADLNNAIIDEKTNYTKAMTALLKEKHNAIKLKIAIANQLQNVLVKNNKAKRDEDVNVEDNTSFSDVLREIKEQKEKGVLKTGGNYRV
jgi:hypothetical protein